MPKMTDNVVEETLRKEVHRLDKNVQVLGVKEDKKNEVYRVTLLKDGKSGSADLKKEVIKQYLSQEGKGNKLRRALGKAVSHLSIKYEK
jgi:hypothetical protein